MVREEGYNTSNVPMQIVHRAKSAIFSNSMVTMLSTGGGGGGKIGKYEDTVRLRRIESRTHP